MIFSFLFDSQVAHHHISVSSNLTTLIRNIISHPAPLAFTLFQVKHVALQSRAQNLHNLLQT
ncbi:MAG: hypothetical protein ABIV51_11865, partial [Saprospiraceae bacterium]